VQNELLDQMAVGEARGHGRRSTIRLVEAAALDWACHRCEQESRQASDQTNDCPGSAQKDRALKHGKPRGRRVIKAEDQPSDRSDDAH
jgi:hypothetical protein